MASKQTGMSNRAKRRKRNNPGPLDSSAYLQGFEAWLLGLKKHDPEDVDIRQAHADALLTYLDKRGKCPERMHELDLRLFLHWDCIEHYHEPPDGQAKLPESIGLFFKHLSDQKVVDRVDWILDACSDRDTYLSRCKSFRSWEGKWEPHYATWCRELEQDLVRRCLLPGPRIDEELEWSENPGDAELFAYEELTDYLLKRRLELMDEGATSYNELRSRLDQIQKTWLSRPKKKFNGRSPVEVVRQERLVPVP